MFGGTSGLRFWTLGSRTLGFARQKGSIQFRWGLWAGLSTEVLLRVQSLLRLRSVFPHRSKPATRSTVSPIVDTRSRSTQRAQGDDRGRVWSPVCCPPRACASTGSARLGCAAALWGHQRPHEVHRTQRHLLSPPTRCSHSMSNADIHQRATESTSRSLLLLRRARPASRCAGTGERTRRRRARGRAAHGTWRLLSA
jgi:hypothetical protein